MKNATLIVATIAIAIAPSGCIAPWASGGDRYAFTIVLGDAQQSTAGRSHCVVFKETRRLSRDLEQVLSSQLLAAQITLSKLPTSECRVPVLADTAGFWLPPVPASYFQLEDEYRLTIFIPGYIATTIYPRGMYNDVPAAGKMAANSWDAPGILLKGYGAGGFGYHDNVDRPLRYERGVHEIIHCTVTIERLGSLSSSVDCDVEAVRLFMTQLYSLSHAISKGFLNRVDPEARLMLADAIGRQEQTISPHLLRRAGLAFYSGEPTDFLRSVDDTLARWVETQ